MKAHSFPVFGRKAAPSQAGAAGAELTPTELTPTALAYRMATRKLAGAVSVLTFEPGEGHMGVPVVSVAPLSLHPPMLLCIVRQSARLSGWVETGQAFAINVLRAHHQALATQLAADHGAEIRLSPSVAWTRLDTGAPVLADALVSFDCVLDEVMARRDHLILLGRVVATRLTEGDGPLLQWGGGYRQLSGCSGAASS
ncbi:flavin reductase family protein [Xanthobacter sp. TB0139]|uniref:flavin reductase family protein n=1 Tax=Xanthobacter sp. TB0139 TaxID=3459178 RepID=UPI00403907EA